MYFPGWQAKNLKARLCTLGGILVLVGAAVYYHHPSEQVLGQADAASYLFSALAIARGEGLGPRQPMLDTMPSVVREGLVETKVPLGLRDAAPNLPRRPFYLEWQLGQERPGDLVPRFPPGQSLVLALGYRVAGWPGLLAVNGIIMLLAGGLAMYLAGKWAGPVAGLLVAGLWAAAPLNVWIANTTLAEPLVLGLGLLAVAAWVRARESQAMRWPLLLGICVGLAPLAKLDALPWILLPVAYAWENRHAGIWRANLPLLAMAPCLMGSAMILFGAASNYAWENAITLIRQPAVRLGLVGAGLGVAILWVMRVRSRRRARTNVPVGTSSEGFAAGRCRVWLKWTGFAGILAGLAFLYFIRPHWAGADRIYWAPMGRIVPTLRELTLQRLGWYLTPAALWVAMASAVAAAIWARELWMRTFAAVGMGVLIFISYDHIDFPVQPFGLRHYLPQAMPVLLIALAGAGSWLSKENRLSRWGRVLAGGVVACAIAWSVMINRKMNCRADGEGLLGHVEAIARQVGPHGVVILRQTSPLAEVAPILAFGFQREVMPVRIRKPEDRRALEDYLEAREQAGASLWLWTGAMDDFLSLPVDVVDTSSSRDITVPFLHVTTTARPLSWDRRTWKSALKHVSFSKGK